MTLFESLFSKPLFQALFDVWSIVVWIILVGEVLVVIEDCLDLFYAHHVFIFGRKSKRSIGTFCLIILSILLIDVLVIDLVLFLLNLHLVL